MPERTRFLPKAELLTLEELSRLCHVFIDAGVRKLRVTGGEPLVRKDVLLLLRELAARLKDGALDELTLTTNGVRLAAHAGELAAIGVRRVNVSLDTLDRDTFVRITGRDALLDVLAGLSAAKTAGLRVKINVVALRCDNAHELPQIIAWAHAQGFDVSLIETMPLGEVDQDRTEQYLSLQQVRQHLMSFWRLQETPYSTSGPSRYVTVKETGGRIGFITPLTDNFCATCNRVRLTCTGRLYMCLGQEDHVDFRDALRGGASAGELRALLHHALSQKPRAHEFSIAPNSAPALARHMSTTGG